MDGAAGGNISPCPDPFVPPQGTIRVLSNIHALISPSTTESLLLITYRRKLALWRRNVRGLGKSTLSCLLSGAYKFKN